MSHVAKVDVKFTNNEAIQAACKRMGAVYCGKGFVKFYDNTEVGGIVVSLPGWEYNIVIQPNGAIQYDNYEGQWGDSAVLDQFKQLYAIEAEGYSYQEEVLPTGVLKLTVNI